MLIPPKPGGNLYRTLQQQSASASSSSLTVPTLHPFWAGIDMATSTREDDLRRKRQWRIDSDQIALIRESAKRFEGTHNFHNFTTGRDFSDKSCMANRSCFIRYFNCGTHHDFGFILVFHRLWVMVLQCTYRNRTYSRPLYSAQNDDCSYSILSYGHSVSCH
jgi:hypothetical protein